MRIIVRVVGVVAVGMLVVPSGAHGASIKEGKWSMTTVIRMEGADDQAAQAMREMESMSPEDRAMMQQMMGGMKIGAPGGGMSMTRTQCLTNDNPVPESNEKGCQQTHTMKGNTVDFEVICEDSRSTGHVTYKNDSMSGTITSTQTEHGRQQHTTIDISGQYIGPCS